MKKYLLLFASAALLLVGCAKEKFAEPIDGGLTNVTFTASLDSGVATKAAADGDGAAANVNRCIMEIYYGDELYARQYSKVTDKKATFTAQMVSNRKYTVVFWADCVDDATNGLATDKYYKTTSLKEITINGSYIGNDDARDAFFHVKEYTVAQAGSSFGGEDDKILLKRPFAQMNVITTDWDKANKVTGLSPEKVKVTIKNALVNFNAVTGEASGSQTLNYEAAVYTPAAHGAEKTLSMDYLFAPKTDKAFIDIDWKALHGTDANVEHAFAAVPYQRNYRTNIKGALLTTQGQWTVTVDPQWDGINDINLDEVDNIAALNQALDNGSNDVKVTLPSDSDVESVTFKEINNPQDVILVFEGELGSQKTIKFTNAEGANGPMSLNITAPAGTSLVFEMQQNHVVINGTSYTNIQGAFSANTLVISKNVTVGTLKITAGGLEIHGTVSTIGDGLTDNVKVRACEGLSETVYTALKEFIDPRYCAIENETTPKTYDIVLNAVAEINGVTYPTLAEAVEAATAGAVVKLIKDIDLNARVEVSEKEISLDLNGKTIEYKGTQLNSGILLVHNGAGLTINGEGFIKSGTSAYAAIALTKSGDNANNPAKLTVNGGVIEGYYYGIVGNGSRHNTQIVINEGTITSTDSEATAIYHPQNGTLTINGGTIIGENGLYIKSGTVADINGATIKATGAKGEYEYSGSGFNHTGDAIIVDNCSYPGGRPTVTIGDATLISDNGFQVGAYFSAPETGISDIYSTEHTDFTVPLGYGWNEEGKLVKKPIPVTSQDEFNAVIDKAPIGAIIDIKQEGEYKVPNISKNVTIKGDDGVKFNCEGSGSIASIPNGATFENVTLNMGGTEYHGFQHAGYIFFKNCTINGYYKTYGNTRFENCVFNQDTYQYCLNAYGDDLDVVNCIFNNKGKAFYCYNEGNPAHYKVNFTGCTFNVEYGTSAKSQIFVKNNVAGQKYTVNISECQIGTSNKTIEEYKSLNLDPDLTNGKGDLRLWNVEEGGAKGQYVKVILENETVYSYGSLE